MDEDTLKRNAAEAAVAMVESGMVVGLGTGSTAAFAIDALIRRVRDGLDIVAIPTSERSAERARAGGVRLTDFGHHPRVDLTIDGADEIETGSLALIKGLGGALLREKIVAASSGRLVIIADDSKLVARLGETTKVPVEVVAFGWESTAARIASLGMNSPGATPVLRRGPDGAPFVTDGGNYILDCGFGVLADAAALERALSQTVGVVESGLFIGMARCALVGGQGGVRRLEAPGS
jgi:ribose 5-phosphate isomerase A